MTTRRLFIFFVVVVFSLGLASPVLSEGVLLYEGFNDSNFSGRSWFDDTSVDLDNSVKYSGVSSLKLTWNQGKLLPSLINAMRKTFTASDEVTISMYWRFNSDWVGSRQAYHPHLVYVLSDLDDPWGGLASNFLNTYIETGNVTPRILFQDGTNINYSYGSLPNNLTNTTENRDTAGCNGCLSGSDCGRTSCYDVGGGTYRNGREWNGSYSFNLNTWYKVTSHFKMNSISGGSAVADGIMRMWIDNTLVLNNTHVVYRTNQHSVMKWHTLVIAPYIGDGSPSVQTMWIDELTISSGYVAPDGGGELIPNPPSDLRISE